MIALIFIFSILAKSYKLPKMTTISVSRYYTKEDMNENPNKRCEEQKKECRTNNADNDEYLKICLMLAESSCVMLKSDGTNVNDVLKKVPKDTDFLLYMSTITNEQTINFNNLPSKMNVLFTTVDLTYLNLLNNRNNLLDDSFDGSQKSINKFAKKILSLGKSPLYSETRIVGNIGNKVSFLLVGNANLIFEGDLNCELLYLVNSKVIYPSDKVKVKHLLVLSDTYSKYKSQFTTNYYDVDQFALINIQPSTQYYRVTYRSTSWGIYYNNYINNGYISSDDWNVPYSIAKSFCLIAYSTNIQIYVEDGSLFSYKNINITITDTEPSTSGYSKQLDKETVYISSLGDWSSVSSKPKVIATIDKSKFDVDKSDSNLNVEVQQIYESPYNQDLDVNERKTELKFSKTIIIIIVAVAVFAVIVVVIVVVACFTTNKRVNNKSSTEDTKDNQEQPQQNQQDLQPQQNMQLQNQANDPNQINPPPNQGDPSNQENPPQNQNDNANQAYSDQQILTQQIQNQQSANDLKDEVQKSPVNKNEILKVASTEEEEEYYYYDDEEN